MALAGRSDAATDALRRLERIHEGLPAEAMADGASVLVWAEDRIRFTQSFVYAQLGNTAQAMNAQDAALAAFPVTYRRGPAQIELQRALCLVRDNDVTGGVRH